MMSLSNPERAVLHPAPQLLGSTVSNGRRFPFANGPLRPSPAVPKCPRPPAAVAACCVLLASCIFCRNSSRRKTLLPCGACGAS